MAAISAQLVKELRERTGLGMMECKHALVESEGDVELAIENLRKSSGMKAAKKAGRTAADGVVAVKVADDNSFGVIVEVNCETDFVARDTNFLGFVSQVLEAAFNSKETDIAVLTAGGLEDTREKLVQKIGENISVRRILTIGGNGSTIGGYTHGNNRIAVLTEVAGGTEELAKDVAMHVAAVNPLYVAQEEVPAELVEKEKEIFKAQAQESGKPAEIIEKMIGGRISKFLAEICLVEQPFVKDPDVKIGALAKKSNAEVKSFIRFEVGEGIEVVKVDFAAEVAAQLKG